MALDMGFTFDNGAPTGQLWVHCQKCSRDMALGWLPMPIDSVVKLLKGNRCACGSKKFHMNGSKKFHMNRAPKATENGDAMAWLGNDDTGISSETIWSVMMGQQPRPRWYPGTPRDPSDFGRCYRLLQVMPEWRPRLREVAEKYHEWRPLVEHWDELSALYEEELPRKTAPKLYKRMKELLSECQP